MRGLEAAARLVLDRRLSRDSRRPLAVALSGGGDSVALVLIADAWAREAGRELIVLTVDHRLQAESAGWATACKAIAQRLDRRFQALAWEGEKPASGLPAAARAARHRLLADAARAADARVVLLGHTADDVSEAQAMREAGATTPDPREWSPSPVWPEGRGLFLLRPLLDVPRADLRAWLSARGETWIEDPANADPRYARARARLAGAAPVGRHEPEPLDFAEHALEEASTIAIAREHLQAASAEDTRRFVALGTVCAGGGERLPAGARAARIAAALQGDGPVIATLAGARVEADGVQVRIFREAGEAARGGLAGVQPPAVWDGRFEFAEGGEVRRLAGLLRRLPAAQQAVLRDFSPAARSGLPAIVGEDGAVTCPALTGTPSLVGERLRAAAGLVQREPD